MFHGHTKVKGQHWRPGVVLRPPNLNVYLVYKMLDTVYNSTLYERHFLCCFNLFMKRAMTGFYFNFLIFEKYN